MPDRDVENLVVGAGPQGLAVAAYTKRYQGITSTVIDPAGWLGNWDEQFARLQIPELDSPLGAHPHPDKLALARYLGLDADALRDMNNRPPTEAFHRFCVDTAKDFGLTTMPNRVIEIAQAGDIVRATLDDGTVVSSPHAVLATNPHTPVIPDWADKFAGTDAPFLHSMALDLRTIDVAGRSVLVVGGGLTATQVSNRLAEKGADVTLISRSPLRSHEQLAFDPAWQASWSLDNYYAIESWEERLKVAATAHAPSAPQATIDEMDRRGVRIGEEIDVTDVNWNGQEFDVKLRNNARGTTKDVVFDVVIAATGARPDLQNEPAVRNLLRGAHVEWVKGYPVLNEDLTIPGTNVAVVGSSAVLQLGPYAYYIFGGRMAAERMQPASVPRFYLDPRSGYQSAELSA